GNVYAAGVDPIYRGVWINVLRHGTNAWSGWMAAGGNFDSVDIDIGVDGRLWIVAAKNETLSLNSYTYPAGLSGWFPISEFSGSSFPLVRAANDGSVYILSMFIRGNFETNIVQGLRVGKYLPGSGITVTKELLSGTSTQPTATVGSDDSLYVCIKESTGA